ncbi:MAG TPA: polymer-forming cytoskeletal protein [Hyphomicrobiaceae bacterium]|nr:polymer-forming cytoskeletal protein [Hyphomicrobiaceae bacterium]
MLFNKKPDDSSAESRRPSAGQPVPDAAPAPSRVQLGSQTQSVIDAWLTISGNLESQGDIRVEGQVAGDIRCANLVVGRDATVSGDIVAEEAVVRGKVKGTIRANRVILQDTACVESAIYHKTLTVDEGATFDGTSCHRQQPHQEEEASTRIVRPGRDAMQPLDPYDRGNGPGSGLHAVEA